MAGVEIEIGMKVLFVAQKYYPHIGGVEKHLRELSTGLLRDGHTVTIIVRKHKDSLKNFEKVAGVDVIRLKNSTKGVAGRFSNCLRVLMKLPAFVTADVVHFHDYSAMWSCAPIVLFLKLIWKRVFITFHGWEGVFPPKKNVIFKRKICEKIADGNICIGHYITKWYGTKPDYVIYGGVHQNTGPTDQGNYAVYIGRLASDTGIFTYLKAWEKIAKENDNLSLIICGDGPLREELEGYACRNNLNNIEFKGFLVETEGVLRNAKIVLTSGYLGILEAFSMGKPVVSVFDNQLKKDYLEMIPHSREMMWIAQDSDEVADCINALLLGQSKTRPALSFAQENSWERVKSSYCDLWGWHDNHL
ncbi:glycosyl transferase [Desulfuromonas versatilis]|uniref:Glycosyl transferase n=1 Tax=Desulfuromonas versatilis TaxID=2802975 RepID=A0ABM8HP29_9BACT|nr:glycosyltransferase family 4 protein [Desulfuromonas versatilis]BCR04671.1 glycosyl transferase [Desulfuromonas versatilis]